MAEERFLRQEMLLGPQAMERLRESHVAVFGIGGVGSYAAEALVRAGVGRLTLVDGDTVSLSNCNRQLIALSSTVGLPKARVMADRARDINPDCRVRALVEVYSAESRERLWDDYHCVLDAIDTVSAKLDLICTARERGVPILSALGTGNRLDPAAFAITDLAETSGCPLARVVRRELRARGIVHHPVVCSTEPARTPLPLEAPPPGRRSVPGSIAWAPAAAGLLMASWAVEQLLDGFPPET